MTYCQVLLKIIWRLSTCRLIYMKISPLREGQFPNRLEEPGRQDVRLSTGVDESLQICKSDFMKLRITATESARKFSEIMNRVHYRGESFIVERGRKPICEILPARPARFTGKDLVALLHSLPRPDDEYLSLVEKLGAKQPRVTGSKWVR